MSVGFACEFADIEQTRTSYIPVRLTARGVEQARVTGRYLAANLGPFDACYVSPWLRTRHTFDHLFAAYPTEQHALS